MKTKKPTCTKRVPNGWNDFKSIYEESSDLVEWTNVSFTPFEENGNCKKMCNTLVECLELHKQIRKITKITIFQKIIKRLCSTANILFLTLLLIIISFYH